MYRIDWRVVRVALYVLTFWNIEEVCRSWENGWSYHFFFWSVGFDYWFWWCLLAGFAIVIYVWSELDQKC